MPSNLEQRILELEVAIAKQSAEQVAMETFFLEFIVQLGHNESYYSQRLTQLKNEKWDSLLRFVENTRPELAAAIDTRTIAEIPTDSQTT